TPFTVLAAPPPFPLQCAIARRAAARCSSACLLPVAQRWGGGPRSGGGAARLRLGAHPEIRYLSPMTDKRELRAAMRAHRKRLADQTPDAAARAAAHVADLPPGRIVAVYRAIGSELDADALCLALERDGRELCLPVVVERDAAMIFRRWRFGDPLELDLAG